MAHKKLFLGKFLGESSSSSDSRSSRSLIHDGTNWYIPETTTTTSENEMVEDPGNRPIQSGAGNRPIQSGAEEESKGSGKNFYTDNSSISPPTSKSEASDKTVPFLGTSAHPITATGSSSLSTEDLDNIPIRTPPSSKTTEVLSAQGFEDDQSDETIIIVTSTPVKSDPPPLQYLVWRQCPVRIFKWPQKFLEVQKRSLKKNIEKGRESSLRQQWQVSKLLI
ncbi:MAG: hypothetical protein MJE68_08435 [Proteobacteria bacterium]|nr:hypothetical protein [Pseudomonadota bacterium]